MYAEIVRLNTEDGGAAPSEGWKETFYMLMEHFFLNGDETCIIAKDGRYYVSFVDNEAKVMTEDPDLDRSIEVSVARAFVDWLHPRTVAAPAE